MSTQLRKNPPAQIISIDELLKRADQAAAKRPDNDNGVRGAIAFPGKVPHISLDSPEFLELLAKWEIDEAEM